MSRENWYFLTYQAVAVQHFCDPAALSRPRLLCMQKKAAAGGPGACLPALPHAPAEALSRRSAAPGRPGKGPGKSPGRRQARHEPERQIPVKIPQKPGTSFLSSAGHTPARAMRAMPGKAGCIRAALMPGAGPRGAGAGRSAALSGPCAGFPSRKMPFPAKKAAPETARPFLIHVGRRSTSRPAPWKCPPGPEDGRSPPVPWEDSSRSPVSCRSRIP